MLAVASPDYLERHGAPRTLPICTAMACINWCFPGSGRILRWRFEKKGKKLENAVEGPLISSYQDVVEEAAMQGLGILYAYGHDRVGEAIAPGHLKRVLADWSPTSHGLYLTVRRRTDNDRRAGHVIEPPPWAAAGSVSYQRQQ